MDFEEIMDQDSDEEILSNDADYASDLSEHDTDYAEKFVPFSKIRALNGRTKCTIQCYTTGGALTVCAVCIHLADTDVVGIYLVRKHDIGYIDALSGRSCTNCSVPMYTIRGQVNKFLENLSEGTHSVMSHYFLTSSIFQLITVKF